MMGDLHCSIYSITFDAIVRLLAEMLFFSFCSHHAHYLPTCLVQCHQLSITSALDDGQISTPHHLSSSSFVDLAPHQVRAPRKLFSVQWKKHVSSFPFWIGIHHHRDGLRRKHNWTNCPGRTSALAYFLTWTMSERARHMCVRAYIIINAPLISQALVLSFQPVNDVCSRTHKKRGLSFLLACGLFSAAEIPSSKFVFFFYFFLNLFWKEGLKKEKAWAASKSSWRWLCITHTTRYDIDIAIHKGKEDRQRNGT